LYRSGSSAEANQLISLEAAGRNLIVHSRSITSGEEEVDTSPFLHTQVSHNNYSGVTDKN